MPWTKVDWDREHKGLTLPQVLFRDPGWFFREISKGKFDDKGPISQEAQELNQKARKIRIPNKEGQDRVAEYLIYPRDRKFAELRLVPRDRSNHESGAYTEHKDVIDLSYPWQLASFDKLGYKLFFRSLKYYLFGNESYKMNRDRCEAFFDNDDNFVI